MSFLKTAIPLDIMGHSYPSGYERARSQFLWTATELNTVGMVIGDIHRPALQLTDYQTDLGRLTISMKQTSASVPTGFQSGMIAVMTKQQISRELTSTISIC